MRKVIKYFVYTLVMLSLIIFFLPKINLYYAAEGFMKTKNLYISDEIISDRGYALELSDAKLFFDNLTLAEVEKINLSVWMFYNALSISNVHINEGFSDFLPQEIENISLSHAFYNPTKVILRGDSDDSYFYGDVDLLKRNLVIHLRLGAKSEKKYGTMLGRLTKEEGGYVYEYKF